MAPMASDVEEKGKNRPGRPTVHEKRRGHCEICTNYRSTEAAQQGLSFHTFPQNPDTRRLWVAAVCREGFIPTAWSVLCSKHFKPQDFIWKWHSPRLKQGVVPSVFDFSQDYCQGSAMIKERNKTVSGMTCKEKPEICISKTHELLLKAQMLMREIEELLDSSTPTDQRLMIQQELQTGMEQDKETLVMGGIRIKSAASGEDLRKLSSQAAGASGHLEDK